MAEFNLSFYEREIVKYTGCLPEEAAIIEEYMRDEVFHSTLDWQTPFQFKWGARRAYDYYQEDKQKKGN